MRDFGQVTSDFRSPVSLSEITPPGIYANLWTIPIATRRYKGKTATANSTLTFCTYRARHVDWAQSKGISLHQSLTHGICLWEIDRQCWQLLFWEHCKCSSFRWASWGMGPPVGMLTCLQRARINNQSEQRLEYVEPTVSAINTEKGDQ